MIPDEWYKEVERSLRTIGDRYGTRVPRRQSGIKGVNPLTQEVAGAWRLANNRTIELSYGWSELSKCYMYGVSTKPDRNYSKACYDFDTVDATVAFIAAADDVDPTFSSTTTRKRL